MKQYIREVISQSYDLNINRIEQTTGGWSADAYIIKTSATEYFVKVYDKQRASVQPWIARMELYMPIVLWLYENTLLRDSMVAPLLTTSGEYKTESEQLILLLFPMLKGITLSDKHLKTEQTRQLAVILAQLHSCGSQLPISTDAIQEDYSLPFLQEIILLMEEAGKSAALQDVLHPYTHIIKKGIGVLQTLSASLRNSSPSCVLCHTDIHGGNLMWTDKVVLIDWEGLRLAPVEADLFTFTDGFFFDYIRDEFLSAYQSIRKNYVVNEETMLFYRLRRRLEDICEFAHSIAYDVLSAQEMADAFWYLQNECKAMSYML